MVVFRDMSESRHLEAQLRQAQKMEALGTLAGGIAHDFNNILAAILGYTELLQDEMPMGSPAQVWLQQVLTAGLRAKALVQQILTFSHRTPAEQTPVSLAACSAKPCRSYGRCCRPPLRWRRTSPPRRAWCWPT